MIVADPPTERQAPSLDSEADFRAWLAGLPPDQIVGLAWQECDCPLATYLLARGALTCSVDMGAYSVDNEAWLPLPRWALEFRRWVDGGGRYGFRRASGESVTAAECLAILGTAA